MCMVGDIIVINDYYDNGKKINKHSFVILNDAEGKIQGLDYNIVCNVMSSFKNKEQRAKKLKYPGNFPITYNDVDITSGNNKEGYIKAEQFYYFDKEKIDYFVIGSMNEEAFNTLTGFIMELNIDIKHIIDNLE